MTDVRGKCAFRERDVTRAVKAVTKAGVEVLRVEIEPGKIVVVAGKSVHDNEMANPWDEVLTDAANEKRPS